MEKRLAKSPVLSPKSPALYERYKSGCAWGLINFFDFRHTHSNGKLISEKKAVNRHALDDACIKNRLNLLSTSVDKKSQHLDVGAGNKKLMANYRKPETKDIVEEEMSIEHQIKKNIGTVKVQNVQTESETARDSPKKHQKLSKSFKKSRYKPVHGFNNAATAGHWESSQQNMQVKSSNDFNLASVTEASCNQVHPKNGGNYGRQNPGSLKHDQLSKINIHVHMNETAEAFINQKLIDGKNLSRDGTSSQSKNFIDALEILNSNKELFIKLLQDPNSLLAKNIQDLHDSQESKQLSQSSSESKLSERETNKARECQEHAETCSESFESSRASSNSQLSNTIVVLKPGSASMQNPAERRDSHGPTPRSHNSLTNNMQTVRPAFFSFDHMKRKLMHAMRASRKQRHQAPLDDAFHKTVNDFQDKEDSGKGFSRRVVRRSAGKTCLDIGGMSSSSYGEKRGDNINQAKNFEAGIGHKATSENESDPKSSNIFDARKNLYEMLYRRNEAGIDCNSASTNERDPKSSSIFEPRKNLSEMLYTRNDVFSRKQPLNALGRITSLPEYDFLPALNYGREREYGFARAHMRFSPYSNYVAFNGDKLSVYKEKSSYLSSSRPNLGPRPQSGDKKLDYQLQTFDAKPRISDRAESNTEVTGNICSLSDDSSHKVNQTSLSSRKLVESDYKVKSEGSGASELPFEPDSRHSNSTNKRTDTVKTCRKSGYFECYRVDSYLENQTSLSLVDAQSSSPLTMQRVECPNTVTDGAEQPSPVPVLQHFVVEDTTSPLSTMSQAGSPLVLKSDVDASKDKYNYWSEYIAAVLQVSHLSWDELSMKCHIPQQILDPSLFDDTKVWPDKPCSDRRLLIGYINEVLLEVHQCYLRCSPWVSFLKPGPQPVRLSKNIVQVVLKHVDWQLCSELPQQTLQELAEMDLAKSRTWMDTQFDAEGVVTATLDSVLADLVVEAAMELLT